MAGKALVVEACPVTGRMREGASRTRGAVAGVEES